MTKRTESQIEEFAIALFRRLGYEYIYGPDIAPDGERPERISFEEVILRGRLLKVVRRINSSIPHDVQEEAIKTVARIASPDQLTNNKKFLRLLTEGKPVSRPKKSEYIYFIYGWLTYEGNYNEIASGVGGTSGSHQIIAPATIFSFNCPIVDAEYIYEYNKQA